MENVLALIRAEKAMFINDETRLVMQDDFGRATSSEIREAWESISGSSNMRRKFTWLLLQTMNFDTACDILGYTLILDFKHAEEMSLTETMNSQWRELDKETARREAELDEREAMLEKREGQCLAISSQHGEMLAENQRLAEKLKKAEEAEVNLSKALIVKREEDKKENRAWDIMVSIRDLFEEMEG